jgi:hypothetical protein
MLHVYRRSLTSIPTTLVHTCCPGSTKLTHLELHCPALADKKAPDVPRRPAAARPAHAPVASMLRENAKDAAAAAADAREREWRAQRGDSCIPAVHRPMAG